jgi:hypothetical protein
MACAASGSLTMKYNDMIAKVKELMPILEEAAKHNERARVVDLAQKICKTVDSYTVLPFAEPFVNAHLERIKRHVKSYLIKSAYGQESEEEIEELVADQETLVEKARGVIQGNTNRRPSRGIRDVISPTEQNFNNTTPMSINNGPRSPVPGNMEYDSQILLDKPSELCDNNLPFSVKDFIVAADDRKEITYSDLINRIERAIEEVENE